MNDTSPSRFLVNGETVECKAHTLGQLLVELGYGASKVATALNGEFVPEKARGATTITEGDAVEIVAPRQGG